MIHVHGLDAELLVPDEWREVPAEIGRRWEHPSGLVLVAKYHDGDRARIEVSVLPADTVAMAPAPRAKVTSAHHLIGWLGGASAEITAPTAEGPVFAQQRRGYAVGNVESMSLFPEPLVVAPGHPQTSVWVVEQLAGDMFQLPPEPDWLPARRHVPYGDELTLRLPDAVVTGVDAVAHNDRHELVGEPGLHTLEVGDMAGISRFEVGWHRDWDELVAGAREGAPDDLWCYLTTLTREPDIDELAPRLARALETPTLWAALAAAHTVDMGLTSHDDALAAAQAVLPTADVATRVALVSRGLATVDSLVGVKLGQVAYDGLLRFGLGRVMSDYPDGAERHLVPVWLWLAGMGESEAAARIGGMVGLAQARALCRASDTLDAEAVAWLSLSG